MTRVGNADHVLLLLRERLQRLDRLRGQPPGRAGAADKATPRPLARLQAAAALDQLSDEEFRRSVLRAVLTEELGDGIANDPAFQTVADDVFHILQNSLEGRHLLEEAARELRSNG